MPRPSGFPHLLAALCLSAFVFVAWSVAADAPQRRGSREAARSVVEAMNAIVESDVAIPAAESTACPLDRLPGSRAALLPLVPGGHRRLIEECATGRLRVRRRLRDFDPLALIDEPADRPAAVAALRRFFAGRAVDVVTGSGLTDGPYPIAFDWAILLDASSGTLFSFILNCRD